MKAILKYPGSKWRIADWVISFFPEHHSYLEPFFGSGATFFQKKRSSIETINDLDSITLFLFLRSIGIYVPGISVSHLEDRSIQEVHKQLGIERVQPLKRADGTVWNKAKIIQEFGFPVLSKEIASKIELLQNPSEKNKTVRHAIITGETGAYGGYQKNSRMKLSQKWLEKFGGYENETEGVSYGVPDFKVSAKCCYYLKEKPCDDWAKQHNSVPYLGLMASEGGRRAKSLKINGCNYFGKSTIRSAPFAIFNRQDILQLALELDVPVPAIYGTIERKEDGTLYTTKAQRTGCSMCGFGIHTEKRPHRFDLLRERNEKEWKFWMYDIGWGHVLDYIGVEWETPVAEQMKIGEIKELLNDFYVIPKEAEAERRRCKADGN